MHTFHSFLQYTQQQVVISELVLAVSLVTLFMHRCCSDMNPRNQRYMPRSVCRGFLCMCSRCVVPAGLHKYLVVVSVHKDSRYALLQHTVGHQCPPCAAVRS